MDVNQVRLPKVQAEIPARDKDKARARDRAADKVAVKAVVDKAAEAEDKFFVFLKEVILCLDLTEQDQWAQAR